MNELLKKLEDGYGVEAEDVLDRLMGDEELYLKYLKELPENKNILNLKTAVESGDVQKAEQEVHTLKGIALNLGILPLSDVCADMLMELRDGNLETGFALFSEVQSVFDEITEAVK